MSQLELTFIIFGTIFILMSVLQIAKEHKKRKVCSDSVYAKVTEIKQKNSIEGKGYLKVFWYPVYTFRFKGRIFQRRDRNGSSHQRNYIGQHVQLYSENYNYADEKWKYPCFPSVEEIAERLQLVLEKVPLIPLELNNCDSEEFWYENRDEDSLQYFSDVVREYADKIAADPRTEEEIFSDIE